jgi:hypothetical protein
MSADMEGMTPDERVIYSRERAEKALSAMPRLSLEEARQRRQAMLCPEQSLTPSRKPRNIANPTARRKPAKRLVHA